MGEIGLTDEQKEALPPDHADHWCAYCEANAYDQEPCSKCHGNGCEDCQQHGYGGYSW